MACEETQVELEVGKNCLNSLHDTSSLALCRCLEVAKWCKDNILILINAVGSNEGNSTIKPTDHYHALSVSYIHRTFVRLLMHA
jgi:hypothetical protein